jgi:hypothetical protein
VSPEKSKELIDLFPELFNICDERNLVAMFGFECGDGWFDLLKDCILSIKEELIKNPWPTNEFCAPPVVNQVKEKYGSLRFYMSQENDEISKIIAHSEARSDVTCETCGKPGNTRVKHYWAYTSCDDCDYSKK